METEKEVKIKDVVHSIKAVFNYLFSKWLIILIFGIAGVFAGLLYALLSKPNYTASLNFILANNSQSSGLMSVASQFGVNLSSGNDNVFSGENIISLMKSRRMVQQAMLNKPLNSQSSLLNIYCTYNQLNTAWAQDEKLKKIYPFPDSLSMMTPLQDSMFSEIYSTVAEKNLDVFKPHEDQDIYNVSTTSDNSGFAYYLTKYVVDVTSSFYILTKTKVASSNLNMLQHEADSLRRLLGNAITNAASETDETFNLNPAYQVQRSSSQQSQAQATIVGTAYGEVVKNLELAKITLQKETPLYQIVDEPSLPLKMDKPGKLTSIILGGIFGGLIIVIYLLTTRFIKFYS